MRLINDGAGVRWCITAQDRPMQEGLAARNWYTDDLPAVLGDRHHLIPWSTLARVLSFVLNHEPDAERAALWTLVYKTAMSQTWLDANASLTPMTLSLIKDKPLLKNDRTYYGQHYVTPLNVNRVVNPKELDATDFLYSIVHDFCWMPGNIFTGKMGSVRDDDPGDDDLDCPPRRLYIAKQAQVDKLFQAYMYLKASVYTYAGLSKVLEAMKDLHLWDKANLMRSNEVGDPQDWVQRGTKWGTEGREAVKTALRVSVKPL